MSADRLHDYFPTLRSALAPTDWSPTAVVGNDPNLVAPNGEASVAVILRARDPLDLLLVRRSQSDADPWSGHMALPGGRRDPEDNSGLDTAIRETYEECGLLMEAGSGLGRLAPVSPQSMRLPTLRVTPYVFGVADDATARVASHEIDAVFWVSLDELRDPTNHRLVQVPLISSVREFPAYTVAGQTVWGMTYRVLSRFLRHYSEALE